MEEVPEQIEGGGIRAHESQRYINKANRAQVRKTRQRGGWRSGLADSPSATMALAEAYATGVLGSRLAAANELDNLEAVAGGNHGLGPLGARQDGKIVFDGYTRGIEANLLEQRGNRCSLRRLPWLAVHLNDDDVLHSHFKLKVPEVWHATQIVNSPARRFFEL